MLFLRRTVLVFIAFLLAACAPQLPPTPPPATVTFTVPPTWTPEIPTQTLTETPTEAPTFTATPAPLVPDFAHIIVVVFENKEFGTVIGSPKMPYFNVLAQTYTLLTQYYAPVHPSLPNYLAMMGGDTFGITSDCEDCFVNAPSLPDLIEQSGRTWRAYQEDMPAPCFIGDTKTYVQKHDPFIYFDPIRLDTARCQRSIVPLTQMDADLASGSFPNFAFVTPNICNDAHDCGIEIADTWLKTFMNKMVTVMDAAGSSYLIVVTWDEGQGKLSCCGLPELAGGRIATILVSPQVKRGFQDDTPYTHYSLLKTIAEAWKLPYLGHAADDSNALITVPWK